MNKILAIIGHFHPILVHLPIAILLLAAIFEGLSRFGRYASLRQSVPVVLWIGTIAAIFSCLTGWLLAQSGSYDSIMQDRHRWLGLATAGISCSACFFQAWRSILLIATTVLLSFTAYNGISLTHGPDFLTSTAAAPSAAEDYTVDFVPGLPVAPAEKATLEKLRKQGITVLPLAQNGHYLTVNFVNVPQPPDSVFLWLAALAPQVVVLNMGEVQIPANAWNNLEKMTQVTKLHLNATNITDAEIVHLKQLRHLQLINLGQTKVTSKGVLQLATLPELRQIFLFNSKVSPTDYAPLQQSMPNVQIDTGKYIVPVLPSDTTKLKAPK